MSSIIIYIGIFLQIIGITFFSISELDPKPFTALIPSILGTIILVLGIIAKAKESIKKHAVHLSLLVALFGIIGSGMRLIPAVLKGSFESKELAQFLTLMFCLTLIVCGIKSFINARR